MSGFIIAELLFTLPQFRVNAELFDLRIQRLLPLARNIKFRHRLVKGDASFAVLVLYRAIDREPVRFLEFLKSVEHRLCLVVDEYRRMGFGREA